MTARAGAFRFNQDLFEEDTVRRWRDYLEKLLAEMVRRPDEAVGGLALAEPAEVRARPAPAPGAPATTTTEWFERQVAKSPAAPALTFGEVHLDYGELSGRANVVAQLSQPVRWSETVADLVRRGATRIVECGPGKVLTGLNRRIERNKAIAMLAVEDPDSLATALQEVSA